MSNKKISSKYVKTEPREHVLLRPNMYIGSITPDTYNTWIYDSSENKMQKRTIKYVPGLYKIYDEILVNAIDHYFRLRVEKAQNSKINLMKCIKINIVKETGIIIIENDGDGIEIVKHPEHHIYIPELILGNMLTSTNYDDTEEKIIGGQNGIGAKACNIFSKYFTITTVDKSRKLMYKQKFSENMSKKEEPEISKSTDKPFTRIEFLPDYKRLNMENLSDEMYMIMMKRAYDTCAVTGDDVTLYFNDEKLEYKNFKKYVDLYLGDDKEHTRVYESINERWEVVASYNDFNGFDQVSFVNGLWTLRGGKHVDYITNQIVKKLTDMIVKKKKNITVKPQSIKDNLIVFVKSTIVDPAFDSQSKETLTTPISKFGSKGELSDKFIDKLYKTGIVEKILEISQLSDNKSLQKTDGKKRTTIRGLPKLDDANFSGGPKSDQCTLILTEGDSASTMAIAGIGAIKNGRDFWGVYSLRGKPLNTMDVTLQRISENSEINNLKKILGLESGKKYNNVKDLRYGKIMIMTDQDLDGTHIRALLANLFYCLWPDLLKINSFITSMNTPIIKIFIGNESISFYSQSDYEKWKIVNPNKKHTNKYFKGLGTSGTDEAKEYFRDLKIVKYIYDNELTDKSINLAFNKKQADERKIWLSNYDKNNIVDYGLQELCYSDFINKDLIHYSNYDVARSIPSICDGLKISQRKILYCSFKRNLTNEIKVAQLSGYVSEKAMYHHGENSLQGAIINMAQNYIGSNNLNLLEPRGQFGSRIHGGKDSASPRYIFTLLSPITRSIFIKDDEDILNYQEDDGMSIEPECYYPIIPMILVNGCMGIGTGFSTTISCYKPEDIIKNLKNLINGNGDIEQFEMSPWYKDFKGSIKYVDGKYISIGCYEKIAPTKIRITELPIGMWTMDFKEHIEDLLEKNINIKNYESYYTDATIDFVIHFDTADSLLEYMIKEKNGFTKIENTFKLVTSKLLGTTNMYLFDNERKIKKYDTVYDIMKSFYHIRYNIYQKRKDKVIESSKYNLGLLDNKRKFVNMVIEEKIIVHKMKKKELEDLLEQYEFMKHEQSYDYLLKIPVYNLTIDMVEKIKNEYIDTKNKLEEYQKLSINTIWINELNKLEEILISESMKKLSMNGKKTPTKKKNK